MKVRFARFLFTIASIFGKIEMQIDRLGLRILWGKHE